MSLYTDTVAAVGLAISANEPIVLISDPGMGKSSTIRALAAGNNLHLETVLMSVREPSDFAGLPLVNPDGSGVTLDPPAWAKRLATAGAGVAFFDEASTAADAVQAAALRVVDEGVVGDLALPDEVRFILAMNPVTTAADGWGLATAMANRVVHIDWTLPADVVADGFSRGFDPISVPSVDPDTIDEFVGEGLRLVGGFLTARADLLSRMPSNASERGGAYPTPRTWEKAGRLLGYCNAAGATGGTRRILVAGAVGDAAATEFLTWADNLDLPDPYKILDGESFDVPQRQDKAYVLCNALLAAYANTPSPARWNILGQTLCLIANEGGFKDLAVGAVHKWLEVAPQNPTYPPDFVATFGALLKEMGRLK